jgi:hypothetical protein
MAILFAAKRTRPDVLLQTTFLSSRCGKANVEDWNKLERIMQYLASTLNKCIDTRCQVQRMEQIQKDSRTMQDSQVLKKIPKFYDSSRFSPLDDDATA